MDIEKKIDDLLARMTLEEKVGQMNQYSGLQESYRDDIRNGLVGSVIFAISANAGNEAQTLQPAEVANDYQRIAVEQSRLGIPLLFARDVIHGHRTVFPIPLGQAAAWSPSLVEHSAQIAAREACTDGIRWTFAPMVDIARDPRWGRIAEGYGEDPYLAGKMAAAAVRGLQGDLGAPDRMLACAKHLAAYGAAEGGRDYNTVDISEQTLRDVYLAPFHSAVRAGVGAIMPAFNEINGIPVTGNARILRGILKGEWGFDGLVVTDWAAIENMIAHGYARDLKDAARIAVQAGIDMEMASGAFLKYLPELVREKKVDEAIIDEAVRRILRIKFRMGLFENPYIQTGLAQKVMLAPEHVAAARTMAGKSVILLKNNGVLPLKKDIRIIGLVGPLAEAKSELFGTWTLDGKPADAVSVLEGIRAAVSKNTSIWCNSLNPEQGRLIAEVSDVAIVVVGEHPKRTGEGGSVVDIDLPPGQQQFLQSVRSAGKPMVAIVIAGRPLSIPWLAEHADAILYVFHPGVQGGSAIADVLFGDVNPSGRLPVTIPRCVGQVPIYYNHKNTGRPAQKENRTTSRYIDCDWNPLYPFGFGLSYTKFQYSNLRITPDRIPLGEDVHVSADVTNAGPLAGEEVVQLYVRDMVGSLTRPVRELKGFTRISLQPGESEKVEFVLSQSDLSFTRADMTFGAEAGRFEVYVGPSSAEGLKGTFELY